MTETRDVGELDCRVIAAQAGDDDAFAWLVDRYSGLAFATAYGWLGNAALAEEVVQDAFARVLTEIGSLRTPAAFPAWLRQITVKCCDRVTRRRSVPLAPIEAAGIVLATGTDPSTLVEEDDERQRVRLAVEALPPEVRLPIVLRYLLDLSTREIAEVLAVPESTVKGRLQAGRRRLRSSFDELVGDALRILVAPVLPPPTPATRLFLAIRAGDRTTVSRLLDGDPALVDATEDWSSALALSGHLPFPNHGSPLLRAVGRGDPEMVALLLERGAPPDRPCGCDVGETPLWTAVLGGDRAMAELLLRGGADPDRGAARGQTPLETAAQRGDTAAVALLRAYGAADRAPNGEAPGFAAPPAVGRDGGSPARPGPLLVTGIRVLDLLAPIERGAWIVWEGRAYVGQMALLSEVTHNLARERRCHVIWTGVPQGGLDRTDVLGELAETGTRSDVQLVMSESKQPAGVRRSVEAALTTAAGLAEQGEDVVVILFVERGVESCADLLVGHCRADDDGSVTGITVTSWVGDRGAPRLDGRSFTGRIALDPALGAQQIYPALDAARSETSALLGPWVTPEHRSLARAMRAAMVERFAAERLAGLSARDPVLGFVRQHFHTRGPIDDQPGVASTLAETLAAARDAVAAPER